MLEGTDKTSRFDRGSNLCSVTFRPGTGLKPTVWKIYQGYITLANIYNLGCHFVEPAA